jgi:hypothetical protein
MRLRNPYSALLQARGFFVVSVGVVERKAPTEVIRER